MEVLEKGGYILGFGALTFAMRNLTEPTGAALTIAAGAMLYACLAGIAAHLVEQVPSGRRLWRAALILIAGTGFASFLFPLPQWAVLFGILFCALDAVRHWRPAAVPEPAGDA